MSAPTYRWPGYAVENGKVYETAGGTNGVQQWREVSRVAATDLLALLSGGTRPWPLPSAGEIERKERPQ